MIVSGEATGCLDLTKIRLGDITEKDSVLVVHLPEPEICSYKIDHSKSKVKLFLVPNTLFGCYSRHLKALLIRNAEF